MNYLVTLLIFGVVGSLAARGDWITAAILAAVYIFIRLAEWWYA